MDNIIEAVSGLVENHGSAGAAIRHGAQLASVELRQVAEHEPVIHRLADVLDDFAASDEETRQSILRKLTGAGFILAGKLMAAHEPDGD